MERLTAEILLPVIKAFAEGKDIEYYSKLEEKWVDAGNIIDFSDSPASYRIKPTPREIFRIEHENGSLTAAFWLSLQDAQEYAVARYPGYRRIVRFVETPI